METSDEDLILQYQNGKSEAYQVLFERYKKPILNFALRILGNRADAEDATGEVFLVLLINKTAYNPKAKFKTWLYTVTRNTCISKLRKRKSVFSLWTKREGEDEYEPWDIPDEGDSPGVALVKKEEEMAVKIAVQKLPEPQKSALILREYHSLNYEQISQILGVSTSNVKILIFRARERLKVELTSFLNEGGSR